MLALFLVSALAAFVSAQYALLHSSFKSRDLTRDPNRSRPEDCKNTLASLYANTELLSCLNAPSLIPVFTAAPFASLVPPINSWLSGLCRAPACGDTTFTAAINNLTSGCADEFGKFGVHFLFQSAVALQQAYPIARRIICFKEYAQVVASE
jgi:hypothetical protein